MKDAKIELDSRLAADHKGMKCSLECAIVRAAAYLSVGGDHARGLGFLMRDEVLKHLKEMATRYYAGDIKAVDEFCQLYCLGEAERKALKEVAQ